MDFYKKQFMEYAALCRSIGIVPRDIFDDWQEHWGRIQRDSRAKE